MANEFPPLVVPEPIDPRLLDPRFATRVNLRYVEGPNKIQAIKLARELTRLGLKQTKDLVEAGGYVCYDIEFDEARLIERRFAEFGSSVELVPCSIAVIAFDPRHPARGAQPLVRMRVTGTQLAIESGRIDAWQVSETREFEQPESLHAAVQAQAAAWTTAGLELARDAAVVIERTSAREPTLEQQIRAAADPSESALVYADWLTARGDPRGELGPLQHVGATPEFEAVLARHAPHLFGPLASLIPELNLGWALGLIARLEFGGSTELRLGSPFELVRKLLALPIAACVRELNLRGTWLSHADPIAAISREVLGGLRSLTLEGDGWGTLCVADWSGLSRLEHLSIFAGRLQLGPLVLPELRNLHVRAFAVDEPLVRAFATAELGSLLELELELTHAPLAQTWINDYVELLRELTQTATLSSLRSLHLEVGQGRIDHRFVAALFDAPFTPGLERLELVAEFTAPAKTLFERRRRALDL